VSVAIKKIPGVESVNVSLNQGLVSIKLAPGNTVRIEQIRKAILNDAFKPREARVEMVGDLVSQNGKLQFKVAGTGEVFAVSTSYRSLQNEVKHSLTVSGLIAAPAKGAEGGTLQIRSVSGPSATKK
jgi:uncharacterized protein (AIM24 family)